ncbi:5-formyltetrahydrofolate cyclo-ligase [Mycobacterium sp. TY815]|uniref:5-formyltetrahydrofolate cyclo-ligase n=1 Tax=Mycobacterium sp. TY815 TaxID=3050581 RepID=UPI002741D8C0|nr:5-formyltetrahydrofolate cyclo-ligase [Mycobacterium sp. TY815]MDP7705829.1 5-formyltetrahydrofolate cyclo-ligase [Mycobacterium sp. TY815]
MATATKSAWRRRISTARRLVTDEQHRAEARMLRSHLEAVVTPGSTVCAYVPVGSEPCTVDMLNELLQFADRVLLPVARITHDEEPLPLLWGRYCAGELITGLWGLKEPPEPWLPESALAEAELVLLPALAVDRRGTRLGRGSGFYDRSLGFRDPQSRLVAIVRDSELVDELPSEPHDVPMTHALTPGRGLVTLPTRE